MDDAVQKYVDRILSYAEGQEPLKVQAATASKLARLVKSIPPSNMRKRPAGHDRNHVQQIERILASAKEARTSRKK
jgi:hypothetical protein